MLKIYQWYRVLSPRIGLRVDNVVFDREREVMYVEVVQMFKLFFLPVDPLPAKLVTRLELRKIKNLYYISRQEDFYHTIDFARLVLPPIAPLVWFLLTFGAIFSVVATKVAQQLGIWTPSVQAVPGDREELYEMDNISSPRDRPFTTQTRA